MLIPFLIAVALLAAIASKTVIREVQLYRRDRRRRHNLLLTMEKYGWDYDDPPRGKHRLRDTPRAHRHCTRHDPCAYKVKHLKGIPAAVYIREAREAREAWEDDQDDYEPTTDHYNTLTGYEDQPYYRANSAA